MLKRKRDGKNSNLRSGYISTHYVDNNALGVTTNTYVKEIHNSAHPHYFKSSKDEQVEETQFTLMGPSKNDKSGSGNICNLKPLDELTELNSPCLRSGRCFLECFYMWYARDIQMKQDMFVNEVIHGSRFRLFMDLDFKLVPNFVRDKVSSSSLQSQSNYNLSDPNHVSTSSSSQSVEKDYDDNEMVYSSATSLSLLHNNNHNGLIKLPDEFRSLIFKSIHNSINRIYDGESFAFPSPEDWFHFHNEHERVKGQINSPLFKKSELFYFRSPSFIEDIDNYWSDQVKAKEREIETESDENRVNYVLKPELEKLKECWEKEMDLAENGSTQSDEDFQLNNLVICERQGTLMFDESKQKSYCKFGIHLHWKNIIVDPSIADLIRIVVIRDLEANTLLNSCMKSLNIQSYGSVWKWENVLDNDVYKERGTNLRLVGSKKYDSRQIGTRNPHITSAYLPTLIIRANGLFDDDEGLQQYKTSPYLMVNDCSIRINTRQKWANSLTDWKGLGLGFTPSSNPSNNNMESLISDPEVRKAHIQKLLGLTTDEMNEVVFSNKFTHLKTKTKVGMNEQQINAVIQTNIRNAMEMIFDDRQMKIITQMFFTQIKLSQSAVDSLIESKKRDGVRNGLINDKKFKLHLKKLRDLYYIFIRICTGFLDGVYKISAIYKTMNNGFTLFTNCRTCPNHGGDHGSKSIFFSITAMKQVYLKCTCKCKGKVGLTGGACSELKLYINRLDDHTFGTIANDSLKKLNRETATKAQLFSMNLSDARPQDMTAEEMEKFKEQKKKEKTKKQKKS